MDNNHGRLTVFIVDDHSAIREGLKAALRRAPPFEVIGESGSAVDALEVVATARPDLLVLDISLPGMGGVVAAERFHAVSPSTRIVVYTMHAERGLMESMKKAGVTAYVLKGEPLADLLETLRMAARGESRYPSATVGQEMTAAVVVDGLPGAHDALAMLSRREREIFLLLADGRSVKEAAFELGLSPKTADTYKNRLMKKLQVDNVVELAKLAIRQSLIQP
jgi:DNA-binding NarL/FixJ family response regulator